MRRIRALGGQTDKDDPTVDARAHEALPAPPSREEEAVLIAERLAALVESRRAGATAPVAAPPPVPTLPTSRTPPNPPTPAPATAVIGARHTGRLLGNLLLTRGFLVESELQFALAKQASTGDPIGQILVDLGLITDRDLLELLAEQMRMDVIDVTRVEPDGSSLSLLTRDTARRLAVLPLRLVDGKLDVAIADPTDDDAVAELTRVLGSSLRLFLASRADIEAAVDRLYGVS